MFRRALVLVIILVWVRVSASDETALDGPSNCESLRRETGGVHASAIPTRCSAATGRPVDSRVTRSCVRPGLRDVERSISGRIALNQDVRCPVPETRRSTVRCTRREARVSLLPRFRSAVSDLCTTVCGARCRHGIGYDPSAGSPTETLLRLLLPLKDQVRTSFSLAVSRTERPSCPDRPVPGEPVRSSH